MDRIKPVIAKILLNTIIILHMAIPSLAFEDVDDKEWYAESVEYVFSNQYMDGIGGNCFAPNEAVTRGMMVTVLYRMDGENETGAICRFSDVEANSYYCTAVAWAAENGIINGYSDMLFGPNDNVTREQMATILYRYSAMKQIDTSSSADLSKFLDKGKVSSYAIDAMRWAYEFGLITGTAPDTLSPLGEASRAQLATIVMRYQGYVASIDIENEEDTDTTTEAMENGFANEDDKTEDSQSNEIQEEEPNADTEQIIKERNEPCIRIETVKANAGEVTGVRVFIDNNPGISSLGLMVAFDERLVLSIVEYHPSIEGISVVPKNLSSPIRLVWVNPDASMDEDGEFATLFFMTPENGSGQYRISVSYDEDDIFDFDGEVVSFKVETGAVIIE